MHQICDILLEINKGTVIFYAVYNDNFDVNKPTGGVLLQCFKVSPPWV